MRARTCLAAVAVMALGCGGWILTTWAGPQTESEKRPGPVSQPSPGGRVPGPPPPGPVGAPSVLDNEDLKAQVDSSMQRMARRVEESRALSDSFGKLADLHDGADRAEILMMRRMSDAMGTMAGEVRTSLEQYRRLLDDETATESGAMKTEVQGLKGVMDVIAYEIDQAFVTLHRLQLQLGQG